MINFRTKVKIPDFKFSITYKSRLFFIGSCFTENIGNLFVKNKFNTTVNPYGVLYNPISVKNSLEILIQNKQFTEKDLHFHNNLWFSFFHHTSFSDNDKQKCLLKINSEIQKATQQLKQCDFLFITFGTARVYKYLKNKQVVSNCHKIPAGEFKHDLLEVDDILTIYLPFLQKIKQFNPKIRIVFTVSPVRHWKDGANGNQISKSTLLLSVNKLKNQNDFCYYFPSYEIVLDELRDYRFFAEDMLHISPVAINYIWEKINEHFFCPETKEQVKTVSQFVRASEHRPFNNQSEEYRFFKQKITGKIKHFQKKYPDIDLQKELDHFNN